MLKIIQAKGNHKAACTHKWVIDIVGHEPDWGGMVREFYSVRKFCEQEFGSALEFDLYCMMGAYGAYSAQYPPNPYWTYDFSLRPRNQIYLHSDVELEKVKQHFGVEG